jgi:threonine dehydratase
MKHLVRSVTIPDSAIVEATQWLFDEAEITAEPSGAATTAALRCGALQVEGPTVLVVSGGNVDVATIPSLKAAT